jgi:PhnB protein
MKLIAYVTFAGNCEEALNFYKDALGGEILQISHMGDGQMEVPENLKDKVMHARLQIGESVLFMSDTFDPSSVNKGNNVSLSLEIDDTTHLKNYLTGFLLAELLKWDYRILFGVPGLECSPINSVSNG